MADPDDMDVEDWRDGKFEVPDPPRKPDFLQGVDNMHWTQFSRRLAATLNQDKTGFDVKLYDSSDPTAPGPDPSVTPWYRLGPPSAVPDYPVLLEKYGLQVLEAAGFLNHESDPISKRINGRLASKPWRIDKGATDIETKIHPVFRQSKWDGITDRQYTLMHPALLLATAILDDPVTLCYLYALAEPVASMDTVSHASAGLTADCKIMKIPDFLTDDQQRDTYMKLCRMTIYLYDWGFDNENLDSLAYTASISFQGGEPEPASKPNTTYSVIRIKRAFIEILEAFGDHDTFYDRKYKTLIAEIEKMAGIPASRQAPISPVSAICRTYCLLATILIHEFVHAFVRAYFEVPNRSTTEGPIEPWAPGDRCNEAGWAFENFVFGGLVKPMKIFIPPMSDDYDVFLCALAPFGSYTTWQWDVWLGNSTDGVWKTMDSDWAGLTEGDREPVRQYPVPQAWTQWMFSDDLWTNHILRFGLEAVKVPKILKWEVRRHDYGELGYHETGEERWNTGEDMAQRDWQDYAPNWDEFFLDGIPKADQIYNGTKWEP